MRTSVVLRCVAKVASLAVIPSTSSFPSSPQPYPYCSTAAESTVHAFRTRDITLRVPSKDHLLRFSFCSTRHLLAETIRRHDLLRSTGAHLDFLQLLGTQLTFANLLASALEGEERVEARFTAEEATIVTEALALGECRCYLRPEYNAKLEERGLPTFPLRVNRILYRREKPFSSLVHADLAELLQPIKEVASGTGTARHHTVDSSDVPFSLYLPDMATRVSLEAWKQYFSYNSSLHAYNYLRRSDGSIPAVWMESQIDAEALRSHDLLNLTDTAAASASNVDEGSCDAIDRKKTLEIHRALLESIPLSFGMVVSPLAAGAAVDRRVHQLNQVVMEAAALLRTSPTDEVRVTSVLQPLLAECADKLSTCQHMLSLFSGDHDGAYQAAVAARQYSNDPAQVAAVVDPIRRALGVHDFIVPLAAAEAARTGLDFFCRCSKQNIVESLASAPSSALASLKESSNFVQCCICARKHTLTDEDWEEMSKDERASSPP